MVSRQLDSLQILRGLAATLVVFDHLFSTSLREFRRSDIELQGLWFAGGLGVHVFFCISGYIITQSLLSAPREVLPMHIFYRKRLVRILPLYWLATTIYALRLTIKGEPPAFDEILRSLFFIPYPDAQGQMRPVLGLGWSLNFEMLFYLVLGFSLLWRTRLAAAGVVAVGLVPLWLAAIWLPEVRLTGGDLGLFVDPVLGYFLAGLALAYITPWLRCRAWLPSLSVRQQAIWQVILLAGLVAVVMTWPESLRWAEKVQVLLAIGLVMLCALQSNQTGQNGWLLRVAKEFGDASYSTYLSHAFVVSVVASFFAYVPGLANGSWVSLALACVLMLPFFNVFGLLIHRRVEKPLMVLVSNMLSRSSRKVAPAR